MPDDIVNEVRAVRHELAAVQRDDIGRIGRDLRRREADYVAAGWTFVSGPGAPEHEAAPTAGGRNAESPPKSR